MRKAFAVLILFISSFVIATPALAQNTQTARDIVLASDQIVNDDYFAAGDTVRISGTVNGDAYVAGGTVIIDGIINGDLLAAGGTITISGGVAEDVRVAGGNIVIEGEIEDDVTVAGGNINLTSSASIAGSLVSAGGNLSVAAPIGGNLRAGVGNLTLSNNIEGNIEVATGMLQLTPDAQVGGDLTYWSDREADIPREASIAGIINRNEPPAQVDREDFEAPIAGIITVSKLFSVLVTLIVGLILIYLFPNYTQTSTEFLKNNLAKSIGYGILAAIFLPIFGVVLLVTVIGIPLGIIILVLYGITIYLAKLITIYAIGDYADNRWGRELNNYYTFLLGSAIYAVIILIPVIGSLFWLLAMLAGLGAKLFVLKSSYYEAKDKKLI